LSTIVSVSEFATPDSPWACGVSVVIVFLSSSSSGLRYPAHPQAGL
jgi:hypothetical protein